MAVGRAEGYGIGVDLGGTNIRAVLGDGNGRIIARISERTEKSKGPEGISQQIIRISRTLMERFRLERVEGVGVASAGTLDPKRERIKKFANLPFDEIPIVHPVKDELKVPVLLLNDCLAAVMGEKMFGAGRSIRNLVYITISTGIGGGIYVDDHVIFGKDGNAHEIGHMTIDMEGRLLCGCGKRGHWEAYCSGDNIPKYARLLLSRKGRGEVEESLLLKLAGGDLDRLSAKMIYDAAKRGDALSLEIIDEIGRANAIGFANVINMYDPEMITVGGTVALKNVDLVINPIKKYVGEYVVNRLPEIRMTALGGDTVLYGALAMVFQDQR